MTKDSAKVEMENEEYREMAMCFVRGLKLGKAELRQVLDELPGDSRLVATNYSVRDNAFYLVFESDDFPPIPVGSIVPIFIPTFLRDINGKTTLQGIRWPENYEPKKMGK